MDITNILIYSGFGIMLLGTLFGMIAAIKGFQLNGYKIELLAQRNPAIKNKIRKYTKPAIILVVSGAIILAIGISVGLSK